MRYRPTNAQRCTAAGWMRQTAIDTMAKLDQVIASSQQPLESKLLAQAHRDLYEKVLHLAEGEQKKWCR